MEEIILIDFKECIAECTTNYKVDICMDKYKYALLFKKSKDYNSPEPDFLAFVGLIIIVMFVMRIFRSYGYYK